MEALVTERIFSLWPMLILVFVFCGFLKFYSIFFFAWKYSTPYSGQQGHTGRWIGLKGAGLEVLKLRMVHILGQNFAAWEQLRDTIAPSQGEISKVLQLALAFRSRLLWFIDYGSWNANTHTCTWMLILHWRSEDSTNKVHSWEVSCAQSQERGGRAW